MYWIHANACKIILNYFLPVVNSLPSFSTQYWVLEMLGSDTVFTVHIDSTAFTIFVKSIFSRLEPCLSEVIESQNHGVLPSLNKAPENQWLEDKSSGFLLRRPIFRGVSFREGTNHYEACKISASPEGVDISRMVHLSGQELSISSNLTKRKSIA